MQENLSASDLAEMIGEYCATCNRLDPSDFMRCQHCGNRICGDCLTEAEDQSGVCTACLPIEIARLQKMAGLDAHRKSGPADDEAAPLTAAEIKLIRGDDLGMVALDKAMSGLSDDEVVVAARRIFS